MEIHWAQNPLESIVEINDYDKQILKLKLRIENLEESLWDVNFALKEGNEFNLEEARRQANDEYWSIEANQASIDRLFGYCLESLSGEHCGDCTCVPCSCIKCYTENLLDIRTLKTNKIAASIIKSAFEKSNTKKLDDVIKYLEKYEPICSGSWLPFPEKFKSLVPKFIKDAHAAAEWLRVYKKEHNL